MRNPWQAMTIPEFSHLLGMIMDDHGLSWIIMDLLGIPIKNHPFSWRVVGEWSKMEAQFYVFYMFHIKTKLKTSKHTQKKGPPFISNHSLGDFPMVFLPEALQRAGVSTRSRAKTGEESFEAARREMLGISMKMGQRHIHIENIYRDI